MNIRYNLANHGFELFRGAGVEVEAARAALQSVAPGEWSLVEEVEYQPAAGDAAAEDWRQDLAAAEAKQMIVWVSLGAANFSNGSLKFCPSSHKHGVLTVKEARAHAARPFAAPELAAGDVLVMHPLTIHASAQCAGTRAAFRRLVFRA